HPADDGQAGRGRLHPELHVLHVAPRALGAARVRHRAHHRAARGLHAAVVLAEHAGHPRRAPPVRAAVALRAAVRAGRHPGADLRHLLGLRARRERARQRAQHRVPRLGEVPDQGAGLVGPAARPAHPHRQRGPPSAPRRVGAARRPLPPQRQRAAARLQPRPRGARPAPRRGEPRPPPRAGDDGAARPRRPRPAAGPAVHGPRRARRRHLGVARPRRLRPPRPGPGPGRPPVPRHPRRRTSAMTAVTPGADPADAGLWKPGGVSQIDPSDARWYQRAVFYELLVRGFYDSNDDGTGDLRGVTEKLDYLQWLGIDCIWLLPFYQSPLRDGGYDISDFFSVLPEYGTIGDAVVLIEEAHKRGIRVIADMVMNHTSDQHPWFQESRQDRTNPKADWYVWNDDDQRWSEARIIFVDTEPSNWTWDPQREQYYWHRFFHHQPDRNYDNPEVRAAMLDVIRFWLDIGLDGFRLDAVPYLFERDGTNGENLPETHEYLREVRKVVDAEYPGKVLLAEANQWPEDVVDYFGPNGDECHMCFHF